MSEARDLVQLETGAIARLTLRAPRANALEPDLLAELHDALDTLEARPPEALVLAGGRNFCSGGDVARFHAAAEAGEARAYATRVVPQLNRALLRLLSLPAPVILAARGAITGGGAGFLFAADLAVLAPDAFVQPYYPKMGFAPDGGWTALLPERIGAGRAAAWLMADERATADTLHAMGLAARIAPDPEGVAPDLIAGTDPGTLRATKALIWDMARLSHAQARLDTEVEAFLDRIEMTQTHRRMTEFVGAGRRAHV